MAAPESRPDALCDADTWLALEGQLGLRPRVWADGRNGGAQRWRDAEEWSAYDWHNGDRTHRLTLPELILSRRAGRLCRTRTMQDHSIAALLAGHVLSRQAGDYRSVYVPGIVPTFYPMPRYDGAPCPELPADDGAILAPIPGRSSVLRAGDVRAAWPLFVALWRVFPLLPFGGHPWGYDDALGPLVALGRWQASPWLGLNEPKSVAMVKWLRESGVISSVTHPSEWVAGLRHDAHVYGLRRPG